MSANTNKAETKKRRPSKTFWAVLGVGAVLAAILVMLAVVFPRQEATRRRLEAEREAKEKELLELELKKESLQELSALIGNRYYLMRYLREHQGYMFKGDIRIDLSDPNAVIPTPGPTPELTPLPTLIPTEDPNSTFDPDATPDPNATEAPDTEAPSSEAPETDGQGGE